MDDGTCPLCTEELDPTDCLLASRLCQCRFSVCLWCFRRITEDAAKDSRAALCPNCREPYDIERISREGRELNPQQLEEVKRKKGKVEEKKKPAAASRPRRDLANVRVVQRNLVYVVGLPMDICYEDVLLSTDYIGQFGKIVKISVSRAGPYGSLAAKNGPTGSAYITFKRSEDARRCIESIHGTTWEGKLVKACYGTTKYCNAFLKGLPCNNGECLYLHDVAAEEDSYTKEETKSTKFVNLVHAASLNQASAVANGQPHGTTSGDLGAAVSGLMQGAVGESEQLGGLEDENSDGSNWPSLQGNAWALKAASMPPQAVPPTEDAQAWPGLPGNRSGNATGNPSSAEASETESEQASAKAALSKPVATMADKIARASSSPVISKAEKKKLTTLSRRAKLAGEGQQESKLKGVKESLSPPRTPQPLQKQPQELEAAAAADTPEEPAGEEISTVVRQLTEHFSKPSAEIKPETPLASKARFEFQEPPASKHKMVTAPPGFALAHQEAGSRLESPYHSCASENSSPAQTSSILAELGNRPSHGSLHSIWGSCSSLEAVGFPRALYGAPPGYEWPMQAQPRSRSRFQFANGDDSTSSAPVHPPQQALSYEQPRTPDISNGLGHAVCGGLFNQSQYHSGGGFPAVYQSFPGSHEWNKSNGTSNTAADANGTLPAGLMLLRKLQSKGGETRQQSELPGSQRLPQGSISHNPAVLSALPSSNGADKV